MSDNIGAMNTVVGVDTSQVVSGLNQAVGASRSFSATVRQDFEQVNAAAAGSVQTIDNLSAAFERMISKMERSSSRGNAGKYFEDFERIEAHLASVRSGFSSLTLPESLKGDLLFVTSLLARIDNLRPTITAQHVATGVSAGQLLPGGASTLPPREQFTNDYMRYQEFQQRMGTQGYQAVPLYDLDMSNVKRIRAEADDIEYQRYQNALRNGGQAGPDYRGMQMYQSDPDLGRMIRTSEQQQRYKEQDEQFAADAEKRRMRAAIENAGNMGPDYSGIHVSQSDPDMVRMIQDQERKTQREIDAARRLERAKEMTVTEDRFYRDQVRDSRNESNDWARNNQAPPPAGPDVYQISQKSIIDVKYKEIMDQERQAAEARRQASRDEATEFENRRRMKEQSEKNIRSGSYDSYVPLPTGFDNSAVLNQQQEKRRGQNDPERNGRRAFIGQQMAFGIDDMTQQFMWSNSTAGGVAAAARAGGNNMTAALGAMDMKPGAMVGAMLGVQGAAMATSMYFKYIEEVEKANASTETLKKTMISMQEAASREVRFKYSLEDKSSKELKEDARSDERKQEETADRKKFVDARASAAEANIARARKKLSGLYNATGVGSAEDYRLAEEIAREEAVLAELTPEKDKLAKDKIAYDKDKPRREEAIKRKEEEEKRKEERDRRSKMEIDNFNKDIADEEKYTGRKLTGEEYKKRYEEFKQSRPDLNFNDENKQVEGNARQQDRDKAANKYEQGNRRFEDERKFDMDMALRMDPMGDIKKKYHDRIFDIDKNYKELSEEERDGLKQRAWDERTVETFERERQIGDGLRKGYRPSEGMVQGSTEEATLNARLTSQVDTEGRDLQKEMNRLLAQINENTKPARREVPPVTQLPP